MTANTPQSRKAKGRRFQQAVRQALIDHLGVPEGDVLSTAMGQSGCDLYLSPAARTLARQVREAADRLATAIEAPAPPCRSAEHCRRLDLLVRDLAAAVHPLTARPNDCVEDCEQPRLLYISGPFSDPDPLHGVERNILLASEAALQGWRQGWAVVCPHKNTAGFQHADDIPYETWIEGDLEILRRCDAICMLPGWENSPGARRELALADELDMDVLVYDPIGQIRDAPSFYRLGVRA